jgi:hypothetical protein
LKACKYNIIIYDYGYAKPIVKPKKNTLLSSVNNQTRSITFDYSNIIHSFMNSKYYGYVKFPNLPPEPMSKNIFAIYRKIQEISAEEVAKNIVDKSDKQYENTIFQRIIEEIFKYAPKNMFITKRPPNVINKTPFYISPPNHVVPNAATSPPKPVKKPAKAANAAKPTQYVNSTEANIAAAILKRKKDYKKFVKEMRVKVKEEFPFLTVAKVMAKVKDLWKTHMRKQEGLSTNASIYTPSK